MGSLATHFSTFLFLFPIGVRRLCSSFSLYLKDPSLYCSKPWFFLDPKWKNLDLYALLVALPIASLTDLFLFLSFSGHPSYRFSFLQHGTIILIFWALLILIVLREFSDPSSLNESFLFVLGGVGFLLEYFICKNGFSGVSSIVYDWLGDLTLVCAFCCLYLSVKPTAFLADFCFSFGLIFKGTWMLQVGLNLYTHTFGFKGCHRLSLFPRHEEVDVKCDLDEDSLRGISLVNLLFVGHTIMVMVACLGLFGLLSRNRDFRCPDHSGPLLARIEPHNSIMQPLPELEMD